MYAGNRLYLVYAFLSTAVVCVAYAALRAFGKPAVDSAAIVAFCALLTPMAVALKTRLGILPVPDGAKVKHVMAARILPFAAATSAACMAATNAGASVVCFLVGFFSAIAYGVYALTQEIDDFVKPSVLLFGTLAQCIVVILLLG